MTLSLTLPVGPSVNNLYRAISSKRGKPARNILTADARKWFSLVIPMIQNQAGDWFAEGDVAVTYAFHFKDRLRRDVFNYEKALSDALTKAHVWKDDCQISDGRVLRMPIDRGNPRVEVTITAI